MPSRPIPALAAAAVALGCWWLCSGVRDAGPAEGRGGEGEPSAGSQIVAVPPTGGPDGAHHGAAVEPAPGAVAIERDARTGALRRRDNLAAAGRRTPGVVAPTPTGIRCPDGSFLPLLNGVPSAPPLLRSPDRGPLPPVVAIVVDRDGWDWYEHADGSTTTSRPQAITGPDGRPSVRVVTLHNAPDATMTEMPVDSPSPAERSR